MIYPVSDKGNSMRKTYYALLLLVVVALLPLSLVAQGMPGASAFSLVRSNGEGLRINFQLPEWSLETVERGGETLQRVVVDGAQYDFIGEEETLPVFATMVAIPYSGGVSLNMLDSAPASHADIRLDFAASLAAERSSGRFGEPLYPADQVLISEPQLLRDFRVVTINVHPFQYDEVHRELLVRDNIEISLAFNDLPSINEMAPPVSYSPAFEKIYRGLILNYDEALNREVSYSSPRMLVIYGNLADTTYQAQVDSYVAWKRQKGFIVTAVSTAVAGTSSGTIKSFIQAQYDNVNTRPDYIVLIGDTSGSMPVPSYNTYIDYYYTWLAGGDNLGDAVIGRISVENTEQMINYMAKIVSLEQEINISTASWLDRMVLVGDTASSGISTIYTNEYIHDHSLAINPHYTYTELYSSSPSSTSINAAINQGVVFYNYRGYIGMSGWPSYISSLNNSYRLFHGVFITCNTGSFGGSTSTTETVVRQGTAATLGGAVTAIGMATSSTHTPMNNCLDVGIFHGIYPLGMRDMGEAMLYGKLYLNAIYGVSNATQAYNFAGFCNIIGDPTAEVYVSVPSSFITDAPTSIPAGTTSLEISVEDLSAQAVEGASVVLTDAAGQQAVAFTNASGLAYLDFSGSLSGSLTLTINKDDFKPLIQTVSIASTGGLVYDGLNIDDSASGNSDGEASAGETADLYISLKNTTSASLTPSGNVSCSDSYVTLISSERIEFNSISANASGESINAVQLHIDADCPDQYRFMLELLAETTGGDWTVQIPIIVSSGKLDMGTITFVGAPGNLVNPGDNWPVTISLTNNGSMDLAGISAILRSRDMFFVVTDSLGYYGSIAASATASNGSNTFNVNARSTCVDGMVIPLELYLYNSSGYAQTVPFTVTLGQTSVTDPLGQDAYGYFIFDDGDTGYDQCPTYSWIGIAPAEGGSGTALALTDPGSSSDEGDQVGAVAIQTVTLPFTFKYYGVDYTQASISSNGFIAFGDTDDADWRNWRMPDAGGPSPMIAVFWDDLDLLSGTSNVYTYYNSTYHYYVVEWYHMISGYDSATQQTFQAILYDPVYYPTHTGDGQVKLQYKDFNNIDLGDGDTYPHGNYCTIGIEDHTETVGLEYTFNNTYPTAAAALNDESALFITTRPLIPDYPYVAMEQVFIYDTNANSHLEPGESAQLSIRLGNRGLVDATGVSAVLSSSDPYVTITASSATYGTIVAQGSAYPQTNYAVTVAAGCPADHQIQFTLNITAATGTWSYNFQLGVFVPELAFSNMIVNDTAGDQNGILDPGETATITIHIANTGEIPAPAGTATLSCSTTGITVNTGTDTFPVIAAGAYEILSFDISAASSMTDGTLVSLVFQATAGTTTASATEYVEVGAPLEVVIGTGTSTQGYPIDRWYNYSAHEAIYLASEIQMAGTLKSLAFYKGSGDDISAIESVTIYMKNTSESTLASGNYTTTGYTQVYSGSYTNNATSGWMEVDLNPMFVYDGVSNLAILTVKGYQQYINSYPQWYYTTSATTRARQNRSDSAAPTNLLATSNLPNLRLKVFPDYDMLLPPQDLAATASHQSVYLTWSAPASGSPTGYKIFRDSSLLATVTSLSYTDLAVTNGTTYTYYLKAVYNGGESDATSSVSAIPNAVAPTNLTAVSGNQFINLSWTAATGRDAGLGLGSRDRSISSYRIYRNGTALTTVTSTTYQDTGLTNGVSYSYYVTTVYANPAGESGPSNTVSATPNPVSYVTIGNGTSTQTYPLDRYYNYSAHEAVYLASEIGMAGNINALAYYKASGEDVNPITPVTIYMKHTTDTALATGVYSTTGYTQVYTGAFPNSSTSGWMEVTLASPFAYNGTSNLSVLIEKGNQAWISNYPYWTYTSTASTRARQERDDNAAPTTLTASSNLPNMRLLISSAATYLPPLNLAATPSHQSVYLTWSAPASGTPTGYKIFKNSSLLTTVTGTSYTDLAVTNGTTYSYYLTAVYSDGESNATATVSATPNAIAPTNLVAVAGNATVDLSWTGATGRDDLGTLGTQDRTISSYRIYRNGSAVTTVTGTTYQDTGLTNDVTYSYYVTTVYTNPAGESSASNTANATPTATSYVVLGSGTSVTSGAQNSPINISNRSVHGQSVYTAAELNAAGVTGPVMITALGFDVVSVPNLALPNFMVRMKHTTSADATSWNTADGLVTAYNATSYMPTVGGYDMLTFGTPFEWNGTDNLLVDTAFNLVATASQSGTLRYTSVANGYRFAYSNTADQTNVFTGGLSVTRRYNIRLAYQDVPTAPEITVSATTIAFGSVQIGTTSTQQFTIQNSGDADLTGSITTPAGYTVAVAGRNTSVSKGAFGTQETDRNTLSFNIGAGVTTTYSLTFAPTAAVAYNGTVVVSSNDTDESTVNITVTGSGYIPPTISLTDTALSAAVVHDAEATDTFTINNSGSQSLTFSITENPAVSWFSASPVSGSIAGGGSRLVTGSFTADNLLPGTYNTTLQISSNDPDDPSLTVTVQLVVNNTLPTIVLPDSFSFDMGGSLVQSFGPYVNDFDGQSLSLSCNGNTNVLVSIDGLGVTFTATAGWHGTEILTFTVSDGMGTASDTVPGIVNLTTLDTPVATVSMNGTDRTLTWAAIPNATSYQIWSSTDPYGTYTLLQTVTGLTYTDTRNLPEAFYRIVAVSN
jgi:uncharacterized membrane protein